MSVQLVIIHQMDYKQVDLESFLPDIYQSESAEEIDSIRAIQQYFWTYFGALSDTEEEQNTKGASVQTVESGKVKVKFFWSSHCFVIYVRGVSIFIDT